MEISRIIDVNSVHIVHHPNDSTICWVACKLNFQPENSSLRMLLSAHLTWSLVVGQDWNIFLGRLIQLCKYSKHLCLNCCFVCVFVYISVFIFCVCVCIARHSGYFWEKIPTIYLNCYHIFVNLLSLCAYLKLTITPKMCVWVCVIFVCSVEWNRFQCFFSFF